MPKDRVSRGRTLISLLKNGLDTQIRPFCYNIYMLEGKCSKCGTYRYGWALLNPRYQTCPKCGAGLEITQNGHRVAKGFSPFTADRLDTNPSTDVPSGINKPKGKREPKEHPHP